MFNPNYNQFSNQIGSNPYPLQNSSLQNSMGLYGHSNYLNSNLLQQNNLMQSQINNTGLGQQNFQLNYQNTYQPLQSTFTNNFGLSTNNQYPQYNPFQGLNYMQQQQQQTLQPQQMYMQQQHQQQQLQQKTEPDYSELLQQFQINQSIGSQNVNQSGTQSLQLGTPQNQQLPNTINNNTIDIEQNALKPKEENKKLQQLQLQQQQSKQSDVIILDDEEEEQQKNQNGKNSNKLPGQKSIFISDNSNSISHQKLNNNHQHSNGVQINNINNIGNTIVDTNSFLNQKKQGSNQQQQIEKKGQLSTFNNQNNINSIKQPLLLNEELSLQKSKNSINNIAKQNSKHSIMSIENAHKMIPTINLEEQAVSANAINEKGTSNTDQQKNDVIILDSDDEMKEAKKYLNKTQNSILEEHKKHHNNNNGIQIVTNKKMNINVNHSVNNNKQIITLSDDEEDAVKIDSSDVVVEKNIQQHSQSKQQSIQNSEDIVIQSDGFIDKDNSKEREKQEKLKKQILQQQCEQSRLREKEEKEKIKLQKIQQKKISKEQKLKEKKEQKEKVKKVEAKCKQCGRNIPRPKQSNIMSENISNNDKTQEYCKKCFQSVQKKIKYQQQQCLKKQKEEEKKALKKAQQQRELKELQEEQTDGPKAQTLIGPDFQTVIPKFIGKVDSHFNPNTKLRIQRIEQSKVFSGRIDGKNYDELHGIIKMQLQKSVYSHNDFMVLLQKYNFQFDKMFKLIQDQDPSFLQQIIQNTGTNVRQTRHKNKRVNYNGSSAQYL